MSGILVHNISDCLQTVGDLFDQIRKRKTSLGIIIWNLEEISYKRLATRLHLRANEANSRSHLGKHNSANSLLQIFCCTKS